MSNGEDFSFTEENWNRKMSDNAVGRVLAHLISKRLSLCHLICFVCSVLRRTRTHTFLKRRIYLYAKCTGIKVSCGQRNIIPTNKLNNCHFFFLFSFFSLVWAGLWCVALFAWRMHEHTTWKRHSARRRRLKCTGRGQYFLQYLWLLRCQRTHNNAKAKRNAKKKKS